MILRPCNEQRRVSLSAPLTVLLFGLAVTGWFAPVFAGPHEGAVLVPHIALDIEYTSSTTDYSGRSGVRDTDEIAVSGPVPDQEDLRPVVWYVLAVFTNTPGPYEMCGVSFGLDDYDSSKIELYKWGNCFLGSTVDLETGGWPGPEEGISIVSTSGGPLGDDEIIEIYWFASYVYGEVLVPLGVDPSLANQEADFGTCVMPSQIDRVDDYNLGKLGFGVPGYNPLSSVPQEGACCTGDVCEIATLSDCASLGGEYQGDNTSCFPMNPCEPALETSWGNLKRLFR